MHVIFYNRADPANQVCLDESLASECQFIRARKHFYSKQPQLDQSIEYPLDDFTALVIMIGAVTSFNEGRGTSLLDLALEIERPVDVSPNHKPFRHAFAGRLWKVADFLGWPSATWLLELFTHNSKEEAAKLQRRHYRQRNGFEGIATPLGVLFGELREPAANQELVVHYISRGAYVLPDGSTVSFSRFRYSRRTNYATLFHGSRPRVT
jgi:hypothetical protein